MKAKIFLLCVSTAALVFVSACGKNAEGQNQSSVTVSGTGTVMTRPDMIQMTVSLSGIAQTTREAQEEVNLMVRQTLDILKNANVEDKNISTASLTFNSEYDYANGRRELIGQKAEQRITFSVDGIEGGDQKISPIIDELIGINGIELNQINFNVKNNTEFFIRSRELAFQKAAEKAAQYAELSGLKLGRVLSIAEEGTQQVLPISNRMVNQASFLAEDGGSGSSTALPAGELEVTTRITAVFLLE